MKIGNLTFENKVFLAPMAGVTDSAFRRICVEQGCGMVTTELISAKGLYYGSENTEALLKLTNEEKPAAVQIFGRDSYIMAKAAERFDSDDRFFAIDINMGCPAPKVVKNGEGSALLKEPELAAEIVREVSKATSKPVTVKYRIGFDSNSINAVEFGKVLEEAGAKCITIHGRTREQMYSGTANWNIIKQVKEAVDIPVVGNGDVNSFDSALRLFQETNCDAIMIGRGAQGNPFIFREVGDYLNGREVRRPTNEEKIDTVIKHLKLEIEDFGEYKAVREMRKHIAWYLKGLKNSIDIKNQINVLTSADEVIKVLMEYKKSII
ncbi:putative tRNA-dihydrouridine synthase 1 [Clostridium bornimense]|uniref:tRNA-dihydrouridine synthase n=1 Tax=Clostridium bornimense TaxID=1216932 RepID=W6RY94_9CLOT|nr:tRNA dihydrouridine synthase DusB [Clostridium bornimense]CDM69636.1 putative tRNA-dihydrouridine synthase 1 [Clostridium bornimense]